MPRNGFANLVSQEKAAKMCIYIAFWFSKPGTSKLVTKGWLHLPSRAQPRLASPAFGSVLHYLSITRLCLTDPFSLADIGVYL